MQHIQKTYMAILGKSQRQELQILSVNEALIEDEGVAFFNETIKNSKLFGFLLALDSEVPNVARAVEYLALFNEAHQMNLELKAIRGNLQKNNLLLTRLLSGPTNLAEERI